MAKMLVAAALGATFGYLWYRVVGCSGGGCPLTSNPYISAGYGAFLGLLLAGGAR
ncbi:MAG: YtxH domain-containing protein [Elusimicrobia bacterium]|nr:YtxH domain-containing protein [Elusimicrobiota bacterium]